MGQPASYAGRFYLCVQYDLHDDCDQKILPKIDGSEQA